jgi:hypothetical protein
VTLESVEEIAGLGFPEFAGSIVAARDEFVSIFIEGAVSEW